MIQMLETGFQWIIGIVLHRQSQKHKLYSVRKTACTFLSPSALQAVNHKVYCLHNSINSESPDAYFILKHRFSQTSSRDSWSLHLISWCDHCTEKTLSWGTPGQWHREWAISGLAQNGWAHPSERLRGSHTSRTGHMCSLLKDSRALEILTHM